MLASFTFMWCMLLITILLIMYAIALEYQYSQMVAYPVPLCYNDYLCKQVVNGEVVEVNMTNNTLFNSNSAQSMCMPLTSDNICNFTYINQQGQSVTEKPGIYLNTWSNAVNCTADQNYEGCPFYSTGDIYWRACYNSTVDSPYNDQDRTYYNTVTNLAACS